MLSVLSRVTRLPWLGTLRHHTNQLFTKHLLLTNTGICVALSGAGDLMQQYFEHSKHSHFHWDVYRSRNVLLSGLVIGPLCHYWYLYLDRMLIGRSINVVVKKVLADQFVMSPICVFTFLLVIGYSEGSSSWEMREELKEKAPPLLKAEWLVWPPAQFINFLFLPTRFRVLYDNIISLGYDNYYSFIKYRREGAAMLSSEEHDAMRIGYKLPTHTNLTVSNTHSIPYYQIRNICGSYRYINQKS